MHESKQKVMKVISLDLKLYWQIYYPETHFFTSQLIISFLNFFLCHSPICKRIFTFGSVDFLLLLSSYTKF